MCQEQFFTLPDPFNCPFLDKIFIPRPGKFVFRTEPAPCKMPLARFPNLAIFTKKAAFVGWVERIPPKNAPIIENATFLGGRHIN